MKRMEIRFLGTGTSSGVPAIACDCAVCRSTDPRNKRRRSSLYIVVPDTSILVDCAPDFREQALACNLRRIDAVLFTHAHADHFFGLDDIRRFNTIQDCIIPAYGSTDTIRNVRRVFSYISQEKTPGLYRPLINFCAIDGKFRKGAIDITPFNVVHGSIDTLGFRFDWRGRSLGYVPDCHSMPLKAITILRGVDVMILDCLRVSPEHVSHMVLHQSLDVLKEIGAERSFLTHMCHNIEHSELTSILPEGIEPAYDGLQIFLEERGDWDG